MCVVHSPLLCRVGRGGNTIIFHLCVAFSAFIQYNNLFHYIYIKPFNDDIL